MKANLRLLPLFLLATVLMVSLSNCQLMKEKVVELVLKGETSTEFSYNDTNEVYQDETVIALTDKIAELLDDAGLSTSDIDSVFVVGVEYGVTAFDGAHDWEITGNINIRRDAGPYVPLVAYDGQSVQAALGERLPQTLEEAGVDVINAALETFIAGGSALLTLQIENGNVVPSPSVGDPIVFTWKIWLTIQVIATTELDVPDPF